MVQRRQDSSVRVHTAGPVPLDIAGMPQPPAWMVNALCAQTDPDGFFPQKGGPPQRAMKAICGQCPVAKPCLEYALDNKEPYGIWGGKSVAERRRMAKARLIEAGVDG